MENIIISLGVSAVSILLCWLYTILCNIDIIQYKNDKEDFKSKLDSLNSDLDYLKDKCFDNDISLVNMLDLLSYRIDDLEKKVDKLSKKVVKK